MTIFSLVERYGVSLFDRNVRNPLKRSPINSEIENTLLNNPLYFWFYNNGITAITQKIPEISSLADEFEVTGLQIINGAQTAYSIYLSMLKCSPDQRQLINDEARVTLRLLKSGGKDFDLKVTRYTNSQNPVSDRDFWSNDTIQEKIQEYFYDTNKWYERRAGEFREKPEEISVVPNTIVASAHLAFWVGNPVEVFEAAARRSIRKEDLIFTSYKENRKGLYEKIFNSETNSAEVFSSFSMLDIITDDNDSVAELFYSNAFHILAISKIVLRKYLKSKYGSNVNISEFINNHYLSEDTEILQKNIAFASTAMKNEIEAGKPEDVRKNMFNLLTKRSHFDVLLEKIEGQEIDLEEIEAIDVSSSRNDLSELEEDEIEAFDQDKESL